MPALALAAVLLQHPSRTFSRVSLHPPLDGASAALGGSLNQAILLRTQLRGQSPQLQRAKKGTDPSVATCKKGDLAPELLGVPARDDPDLALEAEDGDRAGVEAQAAAERGRLLHPPGGERAQDVAVGDERDVAVGAQDLVDDAVDAAADIVGRLAVRGAVAPQVPVGPSLADLGGRDALVVAVVELEQVVAQLRRQAGQLCGLPGARQRRGEDERELATADAVDQRPGAVAPLLRQRHIGAPRVAPVARPLGLRVAQEPDLHQPSAASSATRSSRSRSSSDAGVPRSGPARTRASAGALSAPVTSSISRCEAFSAGSVSVIRSGGGFGESSSPATRSLESSSGWPGNSDAVCPSGPMPLSVRSITVSPSSWAYASAPRTGPSSPGIRCSTAPGASRASCTIPALDSGSPGGTQRSSPYQRCTSSQESSNGPSSS